jgi:predicted 3-demethylubiquinone-9 3-methyltransferase (glyoxalase superfamily)
MKNPIYPCLWFNGMAAEAAGLYCSAFDNSSIVSQNHIVVMFEMAGQKLMLLNGGPEYKPNPSISFYVVMESEQEFDKAWKQLLEGGFVLMPLDKYDWSEKYGWLQDRFGINWQLAIGKKEDFGQKFTPALMFTGSLNGQAEKAIDYYTSVFPGSSVKGIMRYPDGANEVKGAIQHAQFSLGNYRFMAMDSSLEHNFTFNEAVSFVVECDDQDEIDYYWNKLTYEGEEVQCGWLNDRFRVAWQVIPAILNELMSDPERSDRVVAAFMKMKKFDIEKLINA